MSEARLNRANLNEANLRGVMLNLADLSEANLSGANLSEADLSLSNLSEANLSGAILRLTNLREATLNRVNLNWAEPPRVLAQSCRFERGQFAQYEPAQNPYGEGHFPQRRITESQPS